MSVRVNGEPVGTLDLARTSRRTLLIPGSCVTVGADGKATVTLTRTGDLSGTAGIDSLSLGGSWQIGETDGSEPFQDALFRPNAYVTSLVVDARYSSYFLDALYGTNTEGMTYNRCAYRLRFEVPSRVADENRARFTFVTAASSEYACAYGREQVTVFVNDKAAATVTGVRTGSNAIELPVGTFRAGMNVINLVNTTDVTGDADYWGTTQIPKLVFLAHRLEFRDNRGLAFVIR